MRAGVPVREWLEVDGRGGYASGPVAGPRTRRYHALLLATTAPAGRRYVLVNGVDVRALTAAGEFWLSTQRYVGQGLPLAPPARFVPEPWPTWQYELPGGNIVEATIIVEHAGATTRLGWKLVRGAGTRLIVRPFLSGRDYHALHEENPGFDFTPTRTGERVHFRPYAGVPEVVFAATGAYRHDPHWYRSFFYADEAARGFADREALAAPGEFLFDLGAGEEAVLLLAASGPGVIAPLPPGEVGARAWADAMLERERARRAAFASPLERAADAFVVTTPAGRTIIAGYPWFTDWGRDTFIALRGLLLATGRFADATAVLQRWAHAVSRGMLPNRFVEVGEAPEFNAVDAALWFVLAVAALLHTPGAGVSPTVKAELVAAVAAILDGHLSGTRFAIRVTDDGLLAAGEPGLQLTWMDAKVGDWVVTPRIGKPVEIAALWLNALAVGIGFGGPRVAEWQKVLGRGRASFPARFWHPGRGHLHDVVDVDHQPGRVDQALRPNQIFAAGGLPLVLVDADKARAIVDVVERALYVPLGLRTLAPGEAAYCGHYQGDACARDGAYHQGTAWPWLLGPFVEAWVRVRGGSDAVKAEARARFLAPLLAHLAEAGVGHVSEIVDGDPPHRPGGCPFQAWSLGELLRLDRVVLARARHSQ